MLRSLLVHRNSPLARANVTTIRLMSLLEHAAEYSVIHNGKNVWGYDSAPNTRTTR